MEGKRESPTKEEKRKQEKESEVQEEKKKAKKSGLKKEKKESNKIELHLFYYETRSEDARMGY